MVDGATVVPGAGALPTMIVLPLPAAMLPSCEQSNADTPRLTQLLVKVWPLLIDCAGDALLVVVVEASYFLVVDVVPNGVVLGVQ